MSKNCNFRKNDEIDVIGAMAAGMTVDAEKSKEMLRKVADNAQFRENLEKAAKLTGKTPLYLVMNRKQFGTKADRTMEYHEMADKVQKEKRRLAHG